MTDTYRQRPRVRSLGYIGLGVSNLQAWHSYVTRVLGYQWGRNLPDGSQLLRLDEHHQRIVLVPGSQDDIVFAGWEVRDFAELQAIEAHLKRLGVSVSRGEPALAAARAVQAVLVLQDCDGLVIEIYCGPQIESREPFRPSQPLGGFRTGELGLGHIVFSTPDVSRSATFYQDALGLRTTDYIDLELAPGLQTRATFMRCNPRHHSLALVRAPWPKRLLHFMTEVTQIDDVGAAIERAQSCGVRIAATLGRHTNDRMVSFYMESPSGFEVEYGCSGRLIDETTWRLEVFDRAEFWGHRRG